MSADKINTPAIDVLAQTLPGATAAFYGEEALLDATARAATQEGAKIGDLASETPRVYASLDDAIKESTTVLGASQQLWEFKVTFNNHYQAPYVIKSHMIIQLCLIDDLLLWPIRGYVIIYNAAEGWERSYDDIFYHIRADGRDEILLEIAPVTKGSNVTLDEEIWSFKIDCCIYDVEDLPTANKAFKMKKLYFWDKRFQFLQEKVEQWSTSTGQRYVSVQPENALAHTTDYERSMYTGEAIASLLAAAGYENYIDFDNWDWGYSKIVYTTRANCSIWDNIKYILKHHVSEQKNDICFLKWNRGKQKLYLKSFNKLYEQAGNNVNEPGDLQREHLFFEDYEQTAAKKLTQAAKIAGAAIGAAVGGAEGKLAGQALAQIIASKADPWKAPWSDDIDFKRDMKAVNQNTILTYRFTQSSGLDSSHAILTKPVYSHWHKQKQFDVEVAESEISHVKTKHFDSLYVQKLLGRKEPYPVMVLNKTKTEQRAVEPQFSPVSTMSVEDNDRKIRSLLGCGDILKAGIFMNQCMEVRLQGVLYRMSGTFVGVDRLYESSETDYDYQLCGQYLVTSVKHIFQQQKYVTDLVLVKIHAFDKLKDNEEVP